MCCTVKLIEIYTAPGGSQYGFSFMHAAVMARQAEDRANTSPREELRSYLAAQLKRVDNVVGWWGVRDPFNCLYSPLLIHEISNIHYSILLLPGSQGTTSRSRALLSLPSARSLAAA